MLRILNGRSTRAILNIQEVTTVVARSKMKSEEGGSMADGQRLQVVQSTRQCRWSEVVCRS